jgi:feruloyl esterase
MHYHLSRLIAGVILCAFGPHVLGNAFSSADRGAVHYTTAEYRAARACKSMFAASDYHHSVIAAELIPGRAGVPEHCRISGLIPTEVRFEVNLPTQWNGRMYMYGNGGLAGTPATDPGKQRSRDQALIRGFATAYTDTGHDRRVHPGGTFAHLNLHRLVDYGFRAVHLTINSAKTLAESYYDHAPNHSYWQGCSTGGRQAMLSAQRFPEDFDGIIAGAPAANYSGLKFSQAWRVAAISKSGLTEDEALVLADHIYAACDGKDGREDGLISDPRRCDFEPRRDLPHCPGADATDCFDETELDALETYYADVTLGDEVVYPAMPVGSEVLGPGRAGPRSGWYPWLLNDDGPVLLDLLGSDFFRYMVFVKDDPSFDWTTFDFREPPDNLAEFRQIVDAVDPDLSAFRDRGGKLLSYFGWADPDINPLTLIDYFDAVRSLDSQAADYFRVFMVPGMFHCSGGPGPDRFDAITPLIDWVERGKAPEAIDAWHEANGQRVYERPLCAHPKEALPRGNGFACILPDGIR